MGNPNLSNREILQRKDILQSFLLPEKNIVSADFVPGIFHVLKETREG